MVAGKMMTPFILIVVLIISVAKGQVQAGCALPGPISSEIYGSFQECYAENEERPPPACMTQCVMEKLSILDEEGYPIPQMVADYWIPGDHPEDKLFMKETYENCVGKVKSVPISEAQCPIISEVELCVDDAYQKCRGGL